MTDMQKPFNAEDLEEQITRLTAVQRDELYAGFYERRVQSIQRRFSEIVKSLLEDLVTEIEYDTTPRLTHFLPKLSEQLEEAVGRELSGSIQFERLRMTQGFRLEIETFPASKLDTRDNSYLARLTAMDEIIEIRGPRWMSDLLNLVDSELHQIIDTYAISQFFTLAINANIPEVLGIFNDYVEIREKTAEAIADTLKTDQPLDFKNLAADAVTKLRAVLVEPYREDLNLRIHWRHDVNEMGRSVARIYFTSNWDSLNCLFDLVPGSTVIYDIDLAIAGKVLQG